jgi:hypothetical protein
VTPQYGGWKKRGTSPGESVLAEILLAGSTTRLMHGWQKKPLIGQKGGRKPLEGKSMTRINELQRKAILHRQASSILREDAKNHEAAATAIDGGMSEEEAAELAIYLRLLTATIEKATLEIRLAILRG